MAIHPGIGFSKIIVLVGAGYTGSIILKNHSLADILGDLQALVKKMDKSGDQTSDSDYSDALVNQVRRLAMEVRQLASARPITVVNGDSSQIGISSLIIPTAALGALGYGYMWWKGLSFSDLMYVTKHNMANAVANMTKHLEQVSTALAATKRHLTQRIENLDGKLDDQKELTKLIKNEVTEVRADLSQIGYGLDELHRIVGALDGKICTLEDKQDFANAGVWYLCQFISGKDGKMPEVLQGLPKPSNKRGFLGLTESRSLKGLQHIADTIQSGKVDKSQTEAILKTDITNLDDISRCLTRLPSIKC